MKRAEGGLLDKCSRFSFQGMSQDERDKVTQLGLFVYELSTNGFSKIDSVFLSEDRDFEVGQCLRIARVLYSRVERNVLRDVLDGERLLFCAFQAHRIWHTDLFGCSFFDPLPKWEDFPDSFKDQDYHWRRMSGITERSILSTML